MAAKKELRGGVKQWFDRVLGFDDDRPESATWLRRLLQFCVLTAREFRKDLCWERAATLGFTTIISLLPIGFLFLSLFSLSFKTDDDFQAWVADRVLPFVLPEVPEEPPPDLGGEAGGFPNNGLPNNDGLENHGLENDPQRKTTEVVTVPRGDRPGANVDPVVAQEADQEVVQGGDPTASETGLIPVFRGWIRENISLDKFKTQVSGNLLALVALVISALALLVTAERVFNGIWNVARARHYFQKFVAFWVILTTSPVLIAFSIQIHGTEIRFYEFFMPALISSTAFTLLYLFLPNTRVRFVPALVGGCCAGLVWEALKGGFYFYSGHAIGLSAFYGTLALAPIFLVFVYVTWLIILAGAEISYALQHFDQLRFQQAISEKQGRYSYAYLALAYLEHVTTCFARGKEVPVLDEVARDLEADPENLRPVVDSLVRMGVLVEGADGDPRFYPARSPQQVGLREVVEQLIVENFSVEESQFCTGQADTVGGSDSSPSKSFQGHAIRSYLACFDGKTVADLERPDESAPGAYREARVLPESGS